MSATLFPQSQVLLQLSFPRVKCYFNSLSPESSVTSTLFPQSQALLQLSFPRVKCYFKRKLYQNCDDNFYLHQIEILIKYDQNYFCCVYIVHFFIYTWKFSYKYEIIKQFWWNVLSMLLIFIFGGKAHGSLQQIFIVLIIEIIER